jgi:hypothetical protein
VAAKGNGCLQPPKTQHAKINRIRTVRVFDSKKRVGAITAAGDFYIINISSALRSTARQLRSNQRVSFRPARKKQNKVLVEYTDEQDKKDIERVANKKKPEFIKPDPASQPAKIEDLY